MNSRRRVALAAGTAVVLMALSAPVVLAQSNVSGSIVGSSALPKTEITLTNLETGVVRTVTSDGIGSFRAMSLPGGTWRVSYKDSAGNAVERETSVVVGSSSAVSFAKDDVIEMEAMKVSSSTVNPIDFQTTESVTVITDKILAELPVGRSLSAVEMLVPGTQRGASTFGTDLVSFSGSSVAENTYYLNGFNISNFRNGMDPSSVPFEFYNTFDIKSGAYSAEFGRSTGGVINATSKSGSNTFSGGTSIFYSPASLRANQPSNYYKDTDGSTQPYIYNGSDYVNNVEGNVYFSGPLWKNHLFFYGLYNKRSQDSEGVTAGGSNYDIVKDTNPFYGAKLDFFPVKNHQIEYTVFNDSSHAVTKEYGYDFSSKQPLLNAAPNVSYSDRGGLNHIIRYTGTLTDDLSISALYGQNKNNQTDAGSEDGKFAVYDTRTGHADWLSGNPNILVGSGYDKRKAYRFDVIYKLDLIGTHTFKAGLDSEDNSSINNQIYSGGAYYRYYTKTPGSSLQGGTVPTGVTEVARERIYKNNGSFAQKNKAMYVEDKWATFSDRLLLSLGLRNESFDNRNANGATFIKLNHQLAPRLGVSYDLFGDKKTKVFANYGRYHLPIDSNTNIRLGGSEYYVQQYYVLKSINADGTPVLGDKIGTLAVNSDGTIKDPTTIVDKTIKPMYQDEYVIGIQREINKHWKAGVRGLYRNLVTSIDDVCVNNGLAAYAKRNGITNYVAPSGNLFVLTNPGNHNMVFNYDLTGSGKLSEVTLTPKDLGFDPATYGTAPATRKYYASEFFVERVWNSKWSFQGSYTWSHSYGNSEGLVKSDLGQTDAGLTSNFDSVGLMRGAYGDLPNDRRHAFKAYGGYALTSEVKLGANASLISGKPVNKLGVYPYSLDSIANGYGAEAFWTGGDTGSLQPRGSAGRTPWIKTIDLALSYKPKAFNDHLTLSLDVFNVFNFHSVTDVVEQYETATGSTNPEYGLARAYQTPRYVRLGLRLEF